MPKPLGKQVEELRAEVETLRLMVAEHRDAMRAMAHEIAMLKRSAQNVSAHEMMTILGKVKH